MRDRGPRLVFGVATAALAVAVTAAAQDQARKFTDPILVLNTGGHHAPIRALIFSDDEARLISAGEDKVARVWDLSASPPTPERTLRPPIFRGASGAIHALALSPPDDRGQRRLALAGYGFQASRGDIGIYRYPGAADRPQGEIDRWIAAGLARAGVEPDGHVQVVNDLAYDPAGQVLASASSDGTVRLWGAGGERLGTLTPAVPPGAKPPVVTRLAFTPDGARLLTGSGDGVLRAWDVATRRPLAQAAVVANPADPDGLRINALGVSPDGQWAVIGREDGLLLRHDLRAAGLGPAARFATEPRQGAVESLAFAPGGRLATAIASRRLARASDRPDPACDVEIREMPRGQVVERVLSASNLPANAATATVSALAFSPKGRYLAIGGGNDQEVVLKDLGDPKKPLVRLAGRGSGVWDVGFVEPGPGAGGVPAVAYSHAPPSAPRPATYLGFGLKDRAPTTFPAGRVRGPLATFDRWSVRPVSPALLEVMRDGRKQFDVALTGREGRWWSYTFLPPGPGHKDGAVAVACKYGVAIHRLKDGLRTRFLDGHTGQVHCLAPSPDGKWLATGSSDQTVRLWRLAGCDELAPLGAEFERRDGRVFVAKVEARGFAEAGGFEVGDAIETFHLDGRKVAADDFLARYAASPPNSVIGLQVRRKPTRPGDAKAAQDAPLVPIGTTKRDGPLLSLFVGRDREWVLWMPKGYYDSSVTGDSEYLGWHLNRATMESPAPSNYVPLLTYERELRQPRRAEGNVIDRLLAAADDRGVLADAPKPPDVAAAAPPTVAAFAAAGAAIRTRDGRAIPAGSPLPEKVAVDEGTPLAIDWRITPPDGGGLGRFEDRFDGESAGPRALAAAPGATTLASRFDPGPGFHKLRAEATSDRGVARAVYLDVEVKPRPRPAPVAPAPPRLILLALAPEFADKRMAIEHGTADAADLAQFFARHLVAEGTGAAFPTIEGPDGSLIGPKATADRVGEVAKGTAASPVRRGDLVVVVIESHVLTSPRGTRIAAAESRAGAPDTMASADDLAARLGSLARRGCKVLVLVDGVHTAPGEGWDPDLTEWARRLRNREMVTTFLASSRPAGSTSDGHRVFTKAVLDSIEADGRAKGSPLSLLEFRRAVLEAVPRLSALNQEAAGFIPPGIDGRFPLLDPDPPGP